jgi:hypothetical protein
MTTATATIINIDNDSPITYVTFTTTYSDKILTIANNNDNTFTITYNYDHDTSITFTADQLANAFGVYPNVYAALAA